MARQLSDEEIRAIFADSQESEEFLGFGPEDIEADDDDEFAPGGNFGSDLESEEENLGEDENSDSDSESESSDSDDNDEPDWSSEFHDPHVTPFRQQTGPRHMLNLDAKERDFFHLYFPVALIMRIVQETNRYAAQCEDLHGQDSLWRETTSDEISALIGMMIYMGITQVPDVNFYWATNKFLGNLGFKEIMPVKRYHKLMQYLHLNNNETNLPEEHPKRDKLHKLRTVLDTVQGQISRHYRPKKNVSLDEGMIAYKGRFGAKQYMPSKPIKWGLKVWMLCDSVSGFCHKYQIYLGKEQVKGKKSSVQRVVEHLSMGLRGKNHHLYFDSYFTSINLVKSLLRHGIYSCGTIRTNRKGFPIDLKNHPRMLHGESAARQDGNLVATVWQDKNQVTTLSSNASATQMGETTRRQKDGTLKHIMRPEATTLYQQNFRGVDVCDQLRSSYPVGRPGKKWWRYIFNFILNIVIINGYLTMIESQDNVPGGKKRYRQLDFRMRLANQLIGEYRYINQAAPRHRRAPAPRANPVVPAQVELHQHMRLLAKRSRCRSCYEAVPKRRKDTVYGCITCGVHLCSAECHQLFHQ